MPLSEHPEPTHEKEAAHEAHLPLQGVRVLEVGSLIAGPFAGRLLADLGAEVIKVEAPGRLDPAREWGPERYRDHALFWPVLSRNKKLITLDLKKGRETFLRLVEKSDIVIENFRPGTLEGWGLGYEQLRIANQGIVLVRVSGYGQTGPNAARSGFAAVAEAASGLRSLNGYPGEAPPRSGVSLGDSIAGLFAALGALTAIIERDRSSDHLGQVVDVSLIEACLALLESVIPEYDLLGTIRQPSGSGLSGVAPSNIFRSKDEKWVVIAAAQDNLFATLCSAMGHPDLADHPKFSSHLARGEHQDEVEAIVAQWVETKTVSELDEILLGAGIPYGPVNTVAEVVADPHLRARSALVTHHDEVLGELLGPGIMPRLSRTPGEVRWAGSWTAGAHNDEVFRELLGLSDEEMATARDNGEL
jgi:formyl-CoA transferase